jgi:molecular chaperone HtpG
MATETANPERYEFQAEVSQLLDLVVHSLYSNKEIFLRELISNASDALDRLRFRRVTEPELAGATAPLRVRLVPNAEAGTLAIEDTGMGMTKEELIRDLGTIARSGTRAFLEQVKAHQKDGDIRFIGQFGVGFYSAFLVADRVEVTSRAAGSDEAWTWASDAGGAFTISPAERDTHGTTVLLHLKADDRRYTEPWTVRSLVTRYSDFVQHPIELVKAGDDDTESAETINKGSALWLKPRSEITDDEYRELYHHVSHDFEDPLAWTHFSVEGRQLFTGLLYLPKRAPFDMYMPEQRRGVRLYVKRVFVMDDCEELVPQWLRFVRGVIDSDDLPLNVSREILQDSSLSRTIRKQLIKKVLDRMDELARDQKDDYVAFWETFGAVIKEGLYVDAESRERIAKLALYRSSAADGWTSLDEYVARMPEGQKAIYFIAGRSREALAQSPHLEALRSRGYEVLYMTDVVDEVATESLGEWSGHGLVSAMKSDLDLPEAEAKPEEAEGSEPKAEVEAALERFRTVLGGRVTEVRASKRLTDSPVCLVIPEGGLSAHMEAVLRAHDRSVPESRRILEVNAQHPVIAAMEARLAQGGEAVDLDDWIELLYAQALLTEGSALPDPNAFARRMTRLFEAAATAR